MIHRPTIVVLDHGSPYSQLVTRRLRELGVFSRLLPAARAEELRVDPDLAGVIVSGADSASQAVASFDPAVLEIGRPVLAIGHGLGLMCRELGAVFDEAPLGEHAMGTIVVETESPLLRGTPRQQQVWMSQGHHLVGVPAGFDVLARVEGSRSVAMVAHEERRVYGVQFHPEVGQSEFGMQMLENFVRQICGVGEAWDRRRFVEEQSDALARRTAGRRVLCPVSGGADSMVAARLVERAIGDGMTAIFVNTGLMRRHEPETVAHRMDRLLRGNLVTVDATEIFLDRLADVHDAEQKRRVIEETFVDVLGNAAVEEGPFDFLVQGTLYSDRIEGNGTVREHGYTDLPRAIRGLPERLGIEVLEPLSDLFREDVRAVGRELGIPTDLLNRHPFPRSGLAIRVLGPVDAQSLERARAADHVFLEELRNADLYDRIYQAGCILLPVDVAGLVGEARTYARPVVLRAVTSADSTSADWARIPDDVLARISDRILREVDGINRVVYDISRKPPATIEWE